MAVLQPAFTAFLTRKQQRIQQTSILIRSKKMVVAERETVSLLGNNWANLSYPNLGAIDGMWMRSSNGKYGLTPQLEIWQKVGGSNCRTCEGYRL